MTTIFNERTRIIGAETEDGRLFVKAAPEDALTNRELSELILLELKKINIQLLMMTGNEIGESDV